MQRGSRSSAPRQDDGAAALARSVWRLRALAAAAVLATALPAQSEAQSGAPSATPSATPAATPSATPSATPTARQAEDRDPTASHPGTALSMVGREVRIAMSRFAVLQLFADAQLECVDKSTRLEDCDTINVVADGVPRGSLHFEGSRLRVAFRHWYDGARDAAGSEALFEALFGALAGFGTDGTLSAAAVTTFRQRREAGLQVRNIYLSQGRREIKVTLVEPPAATGNEPVGQPRITVTEIIR